MAGTPLLRYIPIGHEGGLVAANIGARDLKIPLPEGVAWAKPRILCGARSRTMNWFFCLRRILSCGSISIGCSPGLVSPIQVGRWRAKAWALLDIFCAFAIRRPLVSMVSRGIFVEL